MADPGFPIGGGLDPLAGHGPPMWVLFDKNVCKNERIWSHGGACAWHTPLDPPMLNIKSYSVSTTEVLGQGAFGVVFKGTAPKNNPIAAKQIDGNQHTQVLTHNCERLFQLDNPHIIRIFDTEQQQGILWMFMECCLFGDLNKFYRNSEVKMDTTLKLMRQIMSGISYLHNQDIIHRDIKPGNILVASEDPLVIKLTDFDVTKCLDPDIETSGMSSNVGTNVFKAPEFFMKKIKYHRNVDIYATGLAFLAIVQHKNQEYQE